MTLDELLDDIFVVERDSVFLGHKDWPEDFPYGVYDTEGCLALFHLESAAYHYRLMIINQRLNTGWDKFPEEK